MDIWQIIAAIQLVVTVGTADIDHHPVPTWCDGCNPQIEFVVITPKVENPEADVSQL